MSTNYVSAYFPFTPYFEQETYDAVFWMVVTAGVVSFVMSYGIGANDVANAFATSVGSKTLKLWHALVIAATFEFAGAVGLGAGVAKTIAGGIANPASFEEDPDAFAFGNLCALSSAAIWLLIATSMELPVSTTHSIVGGVIGFALVYGGADAVIWSKPKDEFPYVDGVVPIVISWFASPIIAGSVAALFFWITRTVVLRRSNAAKLSVWLLPIFLFICLFVNLLFIFLKGAKKQLQWDTAQSCWVAAAAAGGAAVISVFTAVPYLNKRVNRQLYEREHPEEAKIEEVKVPVVEEVPEPTTWYGKLWKRAVAGATVDVHQIGEEGNERVHEMQTNVERFDPIAEYVFSWLQVLTACCVSFAHGSNDTANSIGPFAAIWYVWVNFRVSSSAEAEIWMMALGGAGIVVGLATYGWKIIVALGVKLAALTPSRGFCIELTTALTISVGSFTGLPLSSTHCQVGGTVGVGLVEGSSGMNGWLFAKMFAGWIFTLFAAGGVSALFFAFGVYAPNLITSRGNRSMYEAMYDNMIFQLTEINQTITPDNPLFPYINMYIMAPNNSAIGSNTSVLNVTGVPPESGGIGTRVILQQNVYRQKPPIFWLPPDLMISYFMNVTSLYNYNTDVNIKGIPPFPVGFTRALNSSQVAEQASLG